MIYAVDVPSCGMISLPSFMKIGRGVQIYIPSFMSIDAGVQATISFSLRNLSGCNVGITDGRHL
jgi:hypothetical protein